MNFLRKLFGKSAKREEGLAAMPVPPTAELAPSSESLELLQIGIEAFTRLDFDRAIAVCCQAILLEPDWAVPYYVRGTAIRNLTLGDEQESASFLGLDVQYKEDQWAMFDQLVKLGNKKQSLVMRDYAKAIRLNPELAAAYHNRAIIHAEGERYQQAAADFVNAMVCDSRYSDAYGDLYAQAQSVLFSELVTADTIDAFLRRAKEVGFMVPCDGFDYEGWYLTL